MVNRLSESDNKENNVYAASNERKNFLKPNYLNNVTNVYKNINLTTSKSQTKVSPLKVPMLNTKITTRFKQGSLSPQRKNLLSDNVDDLDRFTAMKRRYNNISFRTNDQGKVIKQSIVSSSIKRNSPLNINSNQYSNSATSSFLYNCENIKTNQSDTSMNEASCYYSDLGSSKKIKAHDLPETQIQAMNETIFKEQVKIICQDSNNSVEFATNSRQEKSRTNSPEKILYNIVEKTSPLKSPLRSHTKEDLLDSNKKKQDTLFSSLKSSISLKKINKIPQRILDAPNFNADIRLTHIAWSSRNILAVVLDNIVYLWDETNNETEVLQPNEKKIPITCVCWCSDSIHLLVAYDNGKMELFDTEQRAKKREIISVANVGILSADWNDCLLVVGNKNGSFTIHDVSKKNHLLECIKVPSQEKDMFISKVLLNMAYNKIIVGTSDGQVRFYDINFKSDNLVSLCFSDILHHENSMIKAMKCNPVYLNVLATGSFDRKFGYMNFYDLKRSRFIKQIETGVEISSINWNYSSNDKKFELAITCGSPNNSIAIYDYNTGFKVAEIPKAHSESIVSGCMNSSNEIIATISAQENLSFFKIFDNQKQKSPSKRNNASPIHKPETQNLLESPNNRKDDHLQSPSKNLTIR